MSYYLGARFGSCKNVCMANAQYRACKSYDHDNQWADLIISWFSQDKRKQREHKVGRPVSDYCFAQYISISPHGIDLYTPDVRRFISWIGSAHWNPWIYVNNRSLNSCLCILTLNRGMIDAFLCEFRH